MMRSIPGATAGSRGRRGAWLGLALLLLVAAGGAAFWWWPARSAHGGGGIDLGTLPPGVARDKLNLVVITLDTTRADRMGAYGNAEVETANFDRIAREGVLFQQAVAVAPLTLPVHSSMFTGKFPPEHGVRDNGGFFLGDDQLTLAEVLKSKGYRTGGFIGAYVLDSKWGISQGFDTYFDEFDLSEVARRLGRGDSASGQRSRRSGAPVDRGSRRALRSSPGSTCTTRTRRIGRPSPSPPGTRGIRTTARSPSPTPRSAASCPNSSRSASTIAR